MLDAKWVVQIYAYDKNGNAYIGTGYAIDDWHILTASHVLFLDERKDNLKFKLVWSEKDTNGELTIKGKKPVYGSSEMCFTEKDIIFNSYKDEYDLAVIRCPNSPPFKPPKVILSDNIHNKNGWETKGFPRLVKKEDERNLIGFDIKYQSQDSFVLTIDTSIKPDEEKFNKNEKIWGGLSGAPVFSGNQLIAVITNDDNRVKNYFYATSIPWVKEHCKEFCEAIKPPIDEEVIKQQTEKLHKVIKTNIEKLLKRNFNLDNLADSFTLPNDAEISYHSIAECLTKQSTRESIAVLIRILRKNQPKNLDDMQEIAGWLLLNSIDSTWWFENEPRMQQTIAEFNLKVSEYFETIISRHALQPAKYTLNFNHTDKSKPSSQEKPYPKPYKEGNKEKKKILVIDADENATDEQLLIPIYKDLWHQNQDIKDDDIKFPVKELLDLIIESADGERIINEGKLVYYLVEKNYLDLLKSKSWFHEKEQLLTNCLRFICCNTDKPEHQEKPCTEGEGFVLSELAKLLQIIEPVKQNEQSQT